MKHCLESKKTGLFYNLKSKEWVSTPIEATRWGNLNPIRFIVYLYVDLFVEDVRFHHILFLKVDFKVLENINQLKGKDNNEK